MRVLVCGSRYWEDQEIVDAVLNGFGPAITCIIEGGAPGADTCAAYWVERYNRDESDHDYPYYIRHEKYPAQWDKYGKAAGPIRNTQMLTEGKPDVVIGFSNNISESRGTRNMLTQAKEAGITTYLIGEF